MSPVSADMVEELLRAWGPVARAGSTEWGLVCQPLLHAGPARAWEARHRGDLYTGRPDRPARQEDMQRRRRKGW